MSEQSSAPAAPPSEAAAPAGASATGQSPWRPQRAGWIAVVIFIALILAGVLAVLAAWSLPPFTSAVRSTEDSYVHGFTTVISPELSGYVVAVPVTDFEHVRTGQVLVRIDPRSYQQQLARAQAELASSRTSLANNEQSLARGQADVAVKIAAIGAARAQQRRADTELRRTRDLVRDGSVSPRENEANVAAAAQAQAGVAEAEAELSASKASLRSVDVNTGSLVASIASAQAEVDSAALNLSRTDIHAPVDGELSDIGVKLGQYVTAGTELFYLVPPQTWVIANFKEIATRDMHPGQRAWFTVDALGGARIDGHVDRLSPATGSQFSVLQPSNATGNFTKVPQRISVYIRIDPGQELADRLKPGLSVETSVDTSG